MFRIETSFAPLYEPLKLDTYESTVSWGLPPPQPAYPSHREKVPPIRMQCLPAHRPVESEQCFMFRQNQNGS